MLNHWEMWINTSFPRFPQKFTDQLTSTLPAKVHNSDGRPERGNTLSTTNPGQSKASDKKSIIIKLISLAIVLGSLATAIIKHVYAVKPPSFFTVSVKDLQDHPIKNAEVTIAVDQDLPVHRTTDDRGGTQVDLKDDARVVVVP